MLSKHTLDAFVFFDLKNIRYCTAFSGTDGVYIFGLSEDCFLSDSRYTEQAEHQVSADSKICYQNKFDGVVDYLKSKGCRDIGFAADILSVAQLSELQKRSADDLIWNPVFEDVRSLRAIKSANEISRLKQAADLNALAFERILPLLKPGISEKQISLELELTLRRLGGEERAFDFIVASGPRGAMPHGVATERIVESGDMVTIDFGTVVSGYHSDETVTVGIGEVGREKQNIYSIVLEAHDRAMAYARPGVELAELDAVARDYITAAGYGDFFGHGLGHGVGLDIHEYPTVSGRSNDRLAEGMVITIEPGIYLPGQYGVRIEDTVEITSTGFKALTSIAKEYRAL